MHALCSLFCFCQRIFIYQTHRVGIPLIDVIPLYTHICLTPVLQCRLVPVVCVSVFSSLRIVNGMAGVVVVDYCRHYCLTVYSQYYLTLVFIFRYDNRGLRSLPVYNCGKYR